jgi:hypothetical protein
MSERAKNISKQQKQDLLGLLKSRFDKYPDRHYGFEWEKVLARLDADTEKLLVLHEMERTGGEPDVTGIDPKTGEYIFTDCSIESPNGRRNLCYDNAGQMEREKHDIHPGGNALDMAAAMGIDFLDEEQYRHLQTLGNFDMKSSSWLKTPADIRKAGGAIFGDRRYGHVFIYHNGAQSFYSARGFRGQVRI